MDGIENPTLLNYGFLDGGFYTTTGIIPSEKYFYKSNLALDEMTIMQDTYLNEGRIDYVVSIQEIETPRYFLKTSLNYYNGEEMQTYYLYKRNDS